MLIHSSSFSAKRDDGGNKPQYLQLTQQITPKSNHSSALGILIILATKHVKSKRAISLVVCVFHMKK